MIGGSTKKFKGAICAVFAAACMIAGGAKAENNFITIGTKREGMKHLKIWSG